MFKENSKRVGVSAIVGGLIILAILFTMIIPLIVLIQNSYAIFLNESNSRRIFDTDRISESLQVEVSRNETTKQLILKLSNNGPVYVNISRIWAIDVSRQKSIPGEGPCLNKGLPGLLPGKDNTTNVQQCVHGFTGYVQFIIVTERGRLFSSNKVYLKEGWLSDIIFPYTLTVSVINMKKGRLYEVYVEPLGMGEVSPEKFTHKATAANENVTVAFGIFPGNYRITLYENGKLASVSGRNPQLIMVPDTTAVVFTLEHGSIIPLSLDVIIISPKNVKERSSFTVEIDIQLPKDANETVTIEYIRGIEISHNLPPGHFDSECESYPGFRISPGDRITAIMCYLWVGEKGGGGPRTITINVPEGTIKGVGDSGSLYFNKSASKTIRVT